MEIFFFFKSQHGRDQLNSSRQKVETENQSTEMALTCLDVRAEGQDEGHHQRAPGNQLGVDLAEQRAGRVTAVQQVEAGHYVVLCVPGLLWPLPGVKYPVKYSVKHRSEADGKF